MSLTKNIHDDDVFELTQDFGLSIIDRAIVDLYRGFGTGDKKGQCVGNKTRSYWVYHEGCKYNTAKKRASELFQKPEVLAYLEHCANEVTRVTNFNAVEHLRESLDHLDVCKGVKPRPIMMKDEDGNFIESEMKEYDVSGVKGALELIGKNKNVDAFGDEKVEQQQMGVVLMPATLSPDEWKATFSKK